MSELQSWMLQIEHIFNLRPLVNEGTSSKLFMVFTEINGNKNANLQYATIVENGAFAYNDQMLHFPKWTTEACTI